MEDELFLNAEVCCDDITPNCGTPVCLSGEEPTIINQVEENIHSEFVKLASVLQESVLHAWKMHLQTKKYSIHVILEEYYNEALEMVDALIEHYQGICNCNIVCDDMVSDVDIIKSGDSFIYFNNLKKYLLDFANNSNNFNEKTLEIKSDIDDILRLIDSTLYKLGHLTESKIKSFDTFVYENLK